MTLSFFDCNTSIGCLAVPQPGSFFTASDLIREMNYFRIDRTLVYHTLAREYSPSEGNARLMEELVGYERFVPCWVIMPHNTGEFPPPDELIRLMARQGVKAVRIFPSPACHNWKLGDWIAGSMFTALAEHCIPLFVSFDQISWEQVFALGKSYPNMPLIVTEVRYEEARNFYPMLEKIQNLHIDLSWTILHFGLEDAVGRFGPSRFLFGSRMPIFSAGPAISYLTYADIDDESKELIAGKNLHHLLDWNVDTMIADKPK